MNIVVLLLIMIALLLLVCVSQLVRINSRLKKNFPTAEEKDDKWALEDPMGYWEAHKDEEESRKKKS
jgi:hypothetical protein